MMRPPFFFLFISLLAAEIPGKETPASLKRAAIQEWKFFDANNILCTINSSGPYADYLRTNSAGLYWPRGSWKTAVFTSGLWIIGRHRPTANLRTAVQNYNTEFQPGPIHGTFNTTLNTMDSLSNPTDPRFRVYKINKKDSIGGVNPDYDDWPGDLGAPYRDVNNDGRWTKGIDKPKFFGDQQLWMVYNDGNSANHSFVGTTPPMGIEVHALFYGFSETGPLNNTMFIRFTIINKSDAAYDSVFFGLWTDTDIGYASDDAAGCDSALALGYFYNGDGDDGSASGYGSTPPANGYLFLNTSPPMPLHAYSVFVKAGMNWLDPSLGSPSYAQHAYNALNGKIGQSGASYINPVTQTPSRFVFNGDPETNTGWTQQVQGLGPQDLRSVLSSGPTSIEKKDTIIINAAFVISKGANYLNSVTTLKEDVRTVRYRFKNNFRKPTVHIADDTDQDSTRIMVAIDGTPINAASMEIDLIEEHNGATLLTSVLYDNGLNGDKTAADGIFSRTFTLPVSPYPLSITARTKEADSTSAVWKDLLTNIPRSNISLSDAVIVSDHLNKDGVANPGEQIRLRVTVNNPNTFSIPYVEVRPTYENNYGVLILDSLAPNSSKTVPYDPWTPGRYLGFSIPGDHTAPTYTERITVRGSNGNIWIDSIVVAVQPFQKITALAARASGKGSVQFSVIIPDKRKISNDTYELRGIDSSFIAVGFRLTNLSKNRTLIDTRFSYWSPSISDNHLFPAVEGINIVVSSYQKYAVSDIRYFSETFRFFNSVGFLHPLDFFRSSVHPADIPPISFRFSKKSGYTDADTNGIFSDNDPYSFDTTDVQRSQRAYLYKLPSEFLGFVPIPFAVYDSTTTPPRRLTVILTRRNSTNSLRQWNRHSDGIYVFNETYSSSGTRYDSTQGGINLAPALNGSSLLRDTIPILAYVYPRYMSPQFLSDTGEFQLIYTPPFSSRDAFVFQPSEFQIETGVVPTTTELFQNYPNPFNPSTTIRYSVPQQGVTTIVIYNAIGQKVKTLLNRDRPAGTYEIDWDGRNENNMPVSSGLYIYRIVSAGMTVTKKMLLLK